MLIPYSDFDINQFEYPFKWFELKSRVIFILRTVMMNRDSKR